MSRDELMFPLWVRHTGWASTVTCDQSPQFTVASDRRPERSTVAIDSLTTTVMDRSVLLKPLCLLRCALFDHPLQLTFVAHANANG